MSNLWICEVVMSVILASHHAWLKLKHWALSNSFISAMFFTKYFCICHFFLPNSFVSAMLKDSMNLYHLVAFTLTAGHKVCGKSTLFFSHLFF